MNKIKLGYQISTGLLSALLLMGVGMYFFNHEMVAEMFTSLGYETYLIYPLGVAKILAVIALWYKQFPTVTEWAYAGLAFTFTLGVVAHLHVGDGMFGGALVALLLLATSYKLRYKLAKK